MIRVDFDPISETVYVDIILNTIIEGKKNILFDDFTLSFVAYQRKWRRVQLTIGNSNMVVLFYISCIVFSTKCYILCMYTLKIVFQFSMLAYSIFV